MFDNQKEPDQPENSKVRICLSTPVAIYLVSMPGEVKDPTQGVNV